MDCAVRSSRRCLGRRGFARLLPLALVVVILAAVLVVVPHRAARVSSTAPVRLLGTTFGLGGTFDGFAFTMPLLFNGTAVPEGDTFTPIPYPAVINLYYPVISDLVGLSDIPYWPQTLKQSERVGAGYLEKAIAALPAGETATILGLSQGAQVAEIARAHMAADPTYVDAAGNYRFVMVGDPYQPNGGILARFTPWTSMPIMRELFPFGRPGPSDSPFATTYYQHQYDGFADFPAYYNLIAVTNAVVGIVFEHAFPGYYLSSPDSPSAVSTTVGNTTYVTIPKRLPLLAPFRIAASLIGAQRFVDALDPILRVFVEMGYERTADPSHILEFDWSTPQEKIQQSMATLPAAFEQAWEILQGTPYVPTLPQPEISDDEIPTPVTEHPVRPVADSPAAVALRRAVEALTTMLTRVTLPLAKVLRQITGHAPVEADGPESEPAPEISESDSTDDDLSEADPEPERAKHANRDRDTAEPDPAPIDDEAEEAIDDGDTETDDVNADDESDDSDESDHGDDDGAESDSEATDSEPTDHKIAS